MSVQDVLAAGRAAADLIMTASCRITRAGEPVWNPVTMQNDTSTITVYSGRCRVRPTGQQDRGQNAADQSFVESSHRLSLPVAESTGLSDADVVEMLSCPDDPDLVGRRFTIAFVPAYSQGTARRIPVRETQ